MQTIDWFPVGGVPRTHGVLHVFDPSPRLGNEEDIIDVRDQSQHQEEERLKEKRGNAIWFVGVGMAMLFLGNVFQALALGGTTMIAWGVVHYFRYTLKISKLRDNAWDDEEIDAWEEELIAQD